MRDTVSKGRLAKGTPRESARSARFTGVTAVFGGSRLVTTPHALTEARAQ